MYYDIVTIIVTILFFNNLLIRIHYYLLLFLLFFTISLYLKQLMISLAIYYVYNSKKRYFYFLCFQTIKINKNF